MAKYTDANETCKNCGQHVGNHTWEEPERKDNESDDSYEKKRTEAQFERGPNHDPNIKCKGYEPSGTYADGTPVKPAATGPRSRSDG